MKRFLLCFSFLIGFISPYLSRSNVPPRSTDSKHLFCGSYPGRIHDELGKAKELRQLITRRSRFALSQSSGASQDIDNIAVIEDDGTIVSPANTFDLTDLNLRMAPSGTGAYTVLRQQGSIAPNLGTGLNLTDDDFAQVSFQGTFRFPFFGTNYSSVFINSDGNITFNQGDAASIARDLARFNSGPPRIAGFFADLDPETSSQGGIFYNQLADRFLITWNRIREFDTTRENTFQLALFPDGSFEITYGTISGSSSIVGWTRGGNLLAVTLVDFSGLGGSPQSGPTAERFSQQTEVELTAVARKFYQTHSDNYDQLVMFTNFPYNLDAAFAFEINIKNSIQGIGIPNIDFSQEFGSDAKLESFTNMNQLAEYPNSPDAIFLGTNSAAEILAHESGHRWLAYVRFKEGTVNSTDLLGRQLGHWSFFFNSEASVLEGNAIRDNEDGSFSTTSATDRYSRLDHYLMGLRSALEVGPLFYVTDVSGTSRTPSSAPAIGVTFSGTRRDLTIDDIIVAEGPRIPDVQIAPKVFRQAFILLVRQGTSPTSAELDKLGRMRRRWQELFSQATDQLGAVNTSLEGGAVVPVITRVVPPSGSSLGNTLVYVYGSNFQNGATVGIGSASATDVQVVSSSLIIAHTGAGLAGVANVVVKNPDADPSTLPNAYTYLALDPVTVSSNTLRVPFIVDNPYFRSNLGINNPNPTAANVRILHLDNNGLLVNQMASVVVPPNGYVQQNSLLRTLEGTAEPSGREGSLVLEADQSIDAFVSQIDQQTADPSILEGIRQGASRLILQSAANTGPFRSTLLVLNLSASEALVNITALNRDIGQSVGVPLQGLKIAANGFLTFENILAALSVNNSFGPVEVRSTNGARLAAVSRVSGQGANTSGFFQSQSADAASQAEVIPLVIDTNAFRTNLGLNNVGTSTASINIALIGTDGTTRASTASAVHVAPMGMLQINNIVRFLLTGSSTSNITQQQGYLKITSNQPIKAFATLIDNLTQDPSIQNSASQGSAGLLLKSSANLNFQSSLAVVNPNNDPITVTLTAREGSPDNNGAITGTRSVNLPANGFYLSDNILQDIGASSSFGPIEIRASSNLPVIAVSRVYSTSFGNISGFFNTQPLP